MSSLIKRATICITANALYSGSAMWRMLNISVSASLIFLRNWKGSGVWIYGGRGVPLLKLEERMDSRDVIAWLVLLVRASTSPEVKECQSAYVWSQTVSELLTKRSGPDGCFFIIRSSK